MHQLTQLLSEEVTFGTQTFITIVDVFRVRSADRLLFNGARLR
jgi:hypothetical protein